MDSRVAYTGLIAIIAIQRLAELAISRRNIRHLRARGGFEVGRDHYPWMVAFHSAFLIACLAEVWFFARPWRPAVAAVSLVVLALAQTLRLWTLRTLGERWTTRVIILPGESLVTQGPFHWIRHPNYLVVIAEIAAIPMVHFAWLTAVVGSVANAMILKTRIKVEEAAWQRSSSIPPVTAEDER